MNFPDFSELQTFSSYQIIAKWQSCFSTLTIFYVVIRFIYTGSVDVTTVIAQDLLRAADQYLLEGLKRLCEYAIAQVGGKSFTMLNYA